MSVRIIPRLDVKGPNLVKGIHLEGLRVLGKPERFARYYYEQGADELLYMDVVASLYQRNNLLEIVTKTAKETFIPLTVGGGLRTLDDIRTVLRTGADKVSLNTAAIADPDLVRRAARQFGSSTIVVSIEAFKHSDGRYEAYTDNGRDSTGIDAFQWAIRAAELGAGELLVTSINQEGTGNGFDLELTRTISQSVTVPVIAGGGAGNVDDVSDVLQNGQADAVCLASILHYNAVKGGHTADDYSTEGNFEFLKGRFGFPKIKDANLTEIKDHLRARGIPCRPGLEASVSG